MDDAPSEPPAQVDAAINAVAAANDDVNGGANGDTTAEVVSEVGDAAPKKRRRKTRRKRKKKIKSDVNPQDVSYGPSFELELVFQKLIFAIAVTTYFFNHSWARQEKTCQDCLPFSLEPTLLQVLRCNFPRTGNDGQTLQQPPICPVR